MDVSRPFRLLPELDDIAREIADLELQQSRWETSRARDGRRSVALAAVARASADAVAAAQRRAASLNRTPEEWERERQEVARGAMSSEDAFQAQYEASWSVASVSKLLRSEEALMAEGHHIADEERRFAHFTELGVVTNPVVRAAIYHYWDVNAMNQPCRCSSCGVLLQLTKQYIGDKLVEVFCAKCHAASHRDELFGQNLALQELYLRRTFDRLSAQFTTELRELETLGERSGRRQVELDEELDRRSLGERFRAGPCSVASQAAKRRLAQRFGYGVLMSE